MTRHIWQMTRHFFDKWKSDLCSINVTQGFSKASGLCLHVSGDSCVSGDSRVIKNYKSSITDTHIFWVRSFLAQRPVWMCVCVSLQLPFESSVPALICVGERWIKCCHRRWLWVVSSHKVYFHLINYLPAGNPGSWWFLIKTVYCGLQMCPYTCNP